MGIAYATFGRKPLLAAGRQVNFNQKELNIAVRWPSSSKIPERYGRAVRATKLPPRSATVQKFFPGWVVAPSSQLPLEVPRDLRIGKNHAEAISPAAPGDSSDPPPWQTKARR